MSRITLSQLKGRGTKPTLERPDPTTVNGALYDLLFKNSGRAINIRAFEKKHSIKLYTGGRLIANIAATYELDVRSCGKGCALLAGRWKGDKYIDYVAAHYIDHQVPSCVGTKPDVA